MIGLDVTTMVVACGTALLVAALISALPALQATRVRAADTLKAAAARVAPDG